MKRFLLVVLISFAPGLAASQEVEDFVAAVQERLQQLGFYGGELNGDFGAETQAALAQFQLSVPVPASGQLDEATLSALGIERPGSTAASGSTGDASEAPSQ